jgi:phosphatidate cytidylyltransferase
MPSSHQKRIYTGIGLLALLAVGLSFRGWMELAILSVLSTFALIEFYGLFKPRQHALMTLAGIAAGLALIFAGDAGKPNVMVIVLLAAFWLGNLRFLVRFSKAPDSREPEHGYQANLTFVAGLVYIPLLLQFFTSFKTVEIILVLLAVIATDTGAYYAGSTFGGKKIWPVISPKKTWAGSAGGMTAAILLCLAMGFVDEYWLAGAGQGRPWWMWLLLGAGLNLAAQFGDFFESALKRKLEVKDSGNILPGHGGILDRIDSLLLAAPAYAGLDAIFDFFI